MKLAKKFFLFLASLLLVFPYLSPAVEAADLRDVPQTSSKYKEIQWAVDSGLIRPVSQGNFNPQGWITEAELITAFAKLDENYYLGYDLDTIYHFYSSLNLPLKGTNPASRNQSLTRGDFARIYAAFAGLDLSEVYAVQYLYTKGITNGTSGKKTYKDYNPGGKLTRADAAVFLYRIAQLGRTAVVGLQSSPSGKDDGKITLPENFLTSGQTIEFNNSGNNYNDATNAGVNPVKNITVEKEELIANGIDSTTITIDLLDCYGNPIQNDQSLKFRVKSKAGAAIATKANSASYYVQSDGGKVTVKVIAPQSTKSIKDTISFELVNDNSNELACYKKKTIDVQLRYIPKAELRVSYEVYNPQSSETKEIPSPVKPIILPESFSPGDIIKATKADTEKTLLETANSSEKIHYGYAELQYAGQSISKLLFESIIQYFDTLNIYYSVNEEGRPVYNIPLVAFGKIDSQSDQTLGSKEKVFVQLTRILQQDAGSGVTLSHYESVKAIYAIYNSLTKPSKDFLNQDYKSEISFIENANKRVEQLLQERRKKETPAGMNGYTKIIVSLVAPGGQVITDYPGTVDITFDGKRASAVPFTTNTRDYLNNTGHAGAAVAYFDHIKEGEAEVALKLNHTDSVYESILTNLQGVVKTTIYTNQTFKNNGQKRNAEIQVAYVLDQSISMITSGQYDFVAEKTRQLIKALQAEHNIAIAFDANAAVEKSGTVDELGDLQQLFAAAKESQATYLADGINVALNHFKNDGKLKYIIVVSDGNTAEKQLRQAIDRAKNGGVKIFAVTVGKSGQINYPLMAELAKETGGEYYQASSKVQFHEAYQSILNLIQYGEDNTDSGDRTVFTDSKVAIARQVVTMTATVNDKLEVAKVIVRFSSVNGEFEVELIHRGANVYGISRPVTMFQDFNIDEEVEFLAYDRNGQLVGSKIVPISQ